MPAGSHWATSYFIQRRLQNNPSAAVMGCTDQTSCNAIVLTVLFIIIIIIIFIKLLSFRRDGGSVKWLQNANEKRTKDCPIQKRQLKRSRVTVPSDGQGVPSKDGGGRAKRPVPHGALSWGWGVAGGCQATDCGRDLGCWGLLWVGWCAEDGFECQEEGFEFKFGKEMGRKSAVMIG